MKLERAISNSRPGKPALHERARWLAAVVLAIVWVGLQNHPHGGLDPWFPERAEPTDCYSTYAPEHG